MLRGLAMIDEGFVEDQAGLKLGVSKVSALKIPKTRLHPQARCVGLVLGGAGPSAGGLRVGKQAVERAGNLGRIELGCQQPSVLTLAA